MADRQTQRGVGFFVAATLIIAGCSGEREAVPCDEDANCDLSPGGRCIAAATGNQWCAYPDPACSGGLRYSDSIGDDLGNTCIDATLVTLQVAVAGPGTVTSVPTGISCSSGTCSGTFRAGTQVRLMANASAQIFLGWSGACRGIFDCTLTLSADTSASALFGNPGTALWAKQFGGTGSDMAVAVAHDSQDNLIVAGVFSGTVAFGSTQLTSAGGVDIFVAKLAQADGSVVWAKRFGGAAEDRATALAVNEQNEIFVSGSIVGTPDLGGGALSNAGARDILLLKLSAAGDYAWAKSFGTTGFDQGTAVAARNGKVALGAYFSETSINVAGTTLTNRGNDEIMLATFTTAGDFQWAKSFGGSSADRPNSVRLDSTGNVIAVGDFQFTVNFGTGSVVSQGSTDAFLLKLAAATGDTLVAKQYGGNDLDTAAAVELDSTDAIFMAGGFRHTVNFGTGPLTASSANNTDAYLMKVSLAGATVWAKAYGGAGNGRRATSVAVTLTNDVVFAGGFNGELSLGGATLSSASGSDDVFLARAASTDGAYVSSTRAGGQGQESALSVTQTSDGKYFVVGGFQGLGDFGGTALTSAGLDDGFAYAMAPL